MEEGIAVNVIAMSFWLRRFLHDIERQSEAKPEKLVPRRGERPRELPNKSAHASWGSPFKGWQGVLPYCFCTSQSSIARFFNPDRSKTPSESVGPLVLGTFKIKQGDLMFLGLIT